MTQQEIQKAFEGRWRIKGSPAQQEATTAPLSFDEFHDHIKSLCRDFFEAGILLASAPAMPASSVAPASAPAGFAAGRAAPTAPSGFAAGEAPTTFDRWWKLYDKKRGREKCLKKWLKMTNAEQLACIEATPPYVASTPDKQYRKDPLTYLNGKCWNDELIYRNNDPNNPILQQQRISKLADILAG